MLVVLINVYLGIYIDSEVLKKNCFPYETAFENFRDEEVSEEVINSFLYDSEPMEESDITEQKIKSVKYDEIKFYKIDDKETDSEEYILVKDNDYKNYSTFFKSDDLSKDAQALFEKKVKVEKTYSTFREFTDEFDTE